MWRSTPAETSEIAILQGDNLWTFKLNGQGPNGIAFGKTRQPKKKIKE